MSKETTPIFKISLGQSSRTGLRERNEDFFGCVTPNSEAGLQYKGIAAIIADGAGGSGGGMEASQYAVGGFFSDYYSTPDSWSIEHSVSQVTHSIKINMTPLRPNLSLNRPPLGRVMKFNPAKQEAMSPA